jgi:uncharacterized membrane protein (DUF485 family)
MLGLVGFVMLLIVWGGRVLVKKEKDIAWMMSVAILLYFILHGLIDTTYFKNDLAVVFWANLLLVL